MGEESVHRHRVNHSSIALLQERFRQLQRMKEMREEREVLRMISESERYCSNSTTTTTTPMQYYEPPSSAAAAAVASSKLFFRSEILQQPCSRPSRLQPNNNPQHLVTLSLWPSQNTYGNNNNKKNDNDKSPPHLWTKSSSWLTGDTPTCARSLASMIRADDMKAAGCADVDTSLHL